MKSNQSPRSAVRRGRVIARLLGLFTASVAFTAQFGCQSKPVNDRPFTAFADSAREVRSGASDAIGKIAGMSKERYLLRTSTGMYASPRDLTDDVLALKLEFADGPDGPDKSRWKSNDRSLLFLELERFRFGVDTLNDALVSYTGMLQQLASPELVDPAWFDDHRKQFDADIRAAAAAAGIKSVDIGVGSKSIDSVAIFATLATELTKRSLFQIQRHRLIEELKNNQEDIDIAAAIGRRAIDIAANALWQEYDLQAQVLVYRGLGKTADGRTDDSSLSDRDKAAAIEALLDLNSAFALQLDGLRTLDRAYTQLPAAHQELLAGLERAPGLNAIVRDLYDSGRRLKKVYEELAKAAAKPS